MSRRDELIETYARELEEITGEAPDQALLRQVTIACEPAIYDPDSELVAAGDGAELERVRADFLVGTLGLADEEDLMGGIQKAIRHYGRSDPRKHRVVLYYLLTRDYGKEHVFV